MLVQHDYGDPYWTPRTSFYGISAMPTVCGDGVSDVWPMSWLEPDYDAHSVISSPLRIKLYENGPGDFTAHIVAEEDVTGASFCMVATLDEYVPAYGGSQSHLEYHVVEFLTATAGDAFELAAGESIDIHRTFVVQPEWDYDLMGVACWVQKPGGVNTSPSPYGDIPIKHRALQSAFLEAGLTGISDEATASVVLRPPAPNPFASGAAMSFVLPTEGRATMAVYDIAGRQVAQLLDQQLEAGVHHASWDGAGSDGRQCASGIYFARLVLNGSEDASVKLVKLR